MSLAPAFIATLVVCAAGCGNLARDVIIDEGSQSQVRSDGGRGDASASGIGADDAGAWGTSFKGSWARCDRDGGCRRKVEESCNRYTCEDWCQYFCDSVVSEECRAKVREYVATGCTCPVLYPLGDDVPAMIHAFADGRL